MNILNKATVTNTEIIKNYKVYKDNAKRRKIVVLKNNEADEILLSITEYIRFLFFIDYMEDLEEEDYFTIDESLLRKVKLKYA